MNKSNTSRLEQNAVSFCVPTFTDALNNPLDYSLSFSVLGWTLSEVGSEVALFLTEEQAEELLKRMQNEVAFYKKEP